MRSDSLSLLLAQYETKQRVHSSRSVGKIKLLAVAAAGIYSPNQILNEHFREDAVSEGILYRNSKLADASAPNVKSAGVT